MSEQGKFQSVNINDIKKFSPEARVNLPLILSKNLITRINCYEPGQVTPTHVHPDDDEVILCVEGRGAVTFPDRESVPMVPGTLVNVPAGLVHGLQSAPDSRMVLVYTARANYTSIRSNPKPGVPGMRLPGEAPG